MVDTTMADEVDTLMHIRGSLQTTEGIDIVLEAGRLAELYNQASTVFSARAHRPVLSSRAGQSGGNFPVVARAGCLFARARARSPPARRGPTPIQSKLA